ncbi:hypothetical protein ACP4OV_021727 [Aristida adscensionis]
MHGQPVSTKRNQGYTPFEYMQIKEGQELHIFGKDLFIGDGYPIWIENVM